MDFGFVIFDLGNLQSKIENQKCLVIGYGNPSRRDDGVAHYVLEKLRAKSEKQIQDTGYKIQNTGYWISSILHPASGIQYLVDILACHQLGIELVEIIKDYDLVIFVDAYTDSANQKSKIKNQKCLLVAPVEAIYHPAAFTHHMNPSSLLALTISLYQKEPRAFIVSVRGYDFDFGTELSPETHKWADEAVNQILDMIEHRAESEGQEGEEGTGC